MTFNQIHIHIIITRLQCNIHSISYNRYELGMKISLDIIVLYCALYISDKNMSKSIYP